MCDDMMSGMTGRNTMSLEVIDLLAQRKELEARGHEIEAESLRVRADIDMVDAKLLRAGYADRTSSSGGMIHPAPTNGHAMIHRIDPLEHSHDHHAAHSH